MKVFEVVTEDLEKTLEDFAASHSSPQGPAGGRCVTPTQPDVEINGTLHEGPTLC